jgi:hypothetical protein
VDNNDDVFLGEKSFAMWHEALDRYETLPVHKNSLRTWRAGHKELFAQMREYLAAAKKEYLANDTAEGLVQPMRAAFPGFDGDVLLPSPAPLLVPEVVHPAGISRRLKTQEVLMKALIFRETGEPKSVLKPEEIPSVFGPWRSARPSAAEPDQRIRSAHGARALWLSAGVASQPGH